MKIFLDTNLLVYCCDKREPVKRRRCRNILKDIDATHTGVISTQVLQEFYVTAVKKLGVEPMAAKSMLHTFENYEIVTVTTAIIKEAVDCCVLNKLSFWDGLIIAAAESAACAEVWSEDLNAGQVIRGVRVMNPLAS